MNELWNTAILNPIFNVLAVLYQWTSNLGVSIILFTTVLKIVLIPLTLPQIKMSEKQRDIQPELKKIKEKFKYDKKNGTF
jgi:YidC/Oxa1 family membrane protein insertase